MAVPAAFPEYWIWRSGPVPPGPVVVFDMDGVLSDAAGRQHHLNASYPDWESFFDACGEDQVIAEVARLLDVIGDDHRIVLLTARPHWVQPQTCAWLARHELRWDLLVMRDYGDYGAARGFKRRVVGELRTYGFDLKLVFEDDRRNLEMFHEAGVPCIYIHSGYYD